MKHKEVRIVSFDVDGTLVNQGFNDLIWENEVPYQVAKKRGWSFKQAKEFCLSEYQKVGDKDIRWYDIKYWLERFGIEVPAREIFKKWEKAIIVYPDVVPTLEKLKERGLRLIIITCMSRIFLEEKIHSFKGYFGEVFSTISDFKQVKSPEVYARIAKMIGAEPESILHVGDHPILDYQFSYQAKYNSLLIERDEKNNQHSIKRLEEIFEFL